MFLANLAGTIVLLFLMLIIKKVFALDYMPRSFGRVVPVFAAVSMAGTPAVTFFCFRYKIPSFVPRRDKGNAERKTILRNLLPAEFLRAVLASLPTKPGVILGFGYRFFDGIFAIAPNFMYDQIYLVPQNRLESIRDHGYITQDNRVFIAVYLVYFVLNLFLQYLLYTKIWKKYEEARNNEVRITMDPEQMK